MVSNCGRHGRGPLFSPTQVAAVTTDLRNYEFKALEDALNNAVGPPFLPQWALMMRPSCLQLVALLYYFTRSVA